jgi:hypothetical protein
MCLIFVRYLRNFNALEERTFEEWASILDLSTRWGFTDIRDLALRCMEPPNPLQRLVLARKYSIERWINLALLELCKRQEPLSLDEARLMDFEDVVLVGSVRQTVRLPTPTVNCAKIRECIQAWRNGEPWKPASDVEFANRPLSPNHFITASSISSTGLFGQTNIAHSSSTTGNRKKKMDGSRNPYRY